MLGFKSLSTSVSMGLGDLEFVSDFGMKIIEVSFFEAFNQVWVLTFSLKTRMRHLHLSLQSYVEVIEFVEPIGSLLDLSVIWKAKFSSIMVEDPLYRVVIHSSEIGKLMILMAGNILFVDGAVSPYEFQDILIFFRERGISDDGGLMFAEMSTRNLKVCAIGKVHYVTINLTCLLKLLLSAIGNVGVIDRRWKLPWLDLIDPLKIWMRELPLQGFSLHVYVVEVIPHESGNSVEICIQIFVKDVSWIFKGEGVPLYLFEGKDFCLDLTEDSCATEPSRFFDLKPCESATLAGRFGVQGGAFEWPRGLDAIDIAYMMYRGFKLWFILCGGFWMVDKRQEMMEKDFIFLMKYGMAMLELELTIQNTWIGDNRDNAVISLRAQSMRRDQKFKVMNVVSVPTERGYDVSILKMNLVCGEVMWLILLIIINNEEPGPEGTQMLRMAKNRTSHVGKRIEGLGHSMARSAQGKSRLDGYHSGMSNVAGNAKVLMHTNFSWMIDVEDACGFTTFSIENLVNVFTSTGKAEADLAFTGYVGSAGKQACGDMMNFLQIPIFIAPD